MPKRPVPTKDKPNVVLFGIDSLLSTHMSCYGYQHYTTPHIDEFAEEGVLFENNFCPHVPTTSGYASMLTGRDCFGTNVVALRHHGPMSDKTKTLAEILAKAGYDTSCVGFTERCERTPAAAIVRRMAIASSVARIASCALVTFSPRWSSVTWMRRCWLP